ncbi:MAG: glutamyl-tRNA reductase [Candidatus Scalindua sp.]|nr:glutamyl-tRNA reductase [Candidatus Scalindua sp.]
MNLHAIGLNHKSAPVEIREKLAFSASSIPIALSSFTQSFSSSETVILSTCNRVEIYGTSPDDCLNKESLLDFFSAFHGLPKEKFSEHMYHYQNLDAVKHLFFVTSSLDSLVVGESQILSQVKEAYMTAASQEATGSILNQLFQRALSVAKDIHTKTNISKGKVSISSVAVEFAVKIFKDFSDKTVFIIGAGEMCELVLKHLVEQGTKTAIVANRNYDKAQALADEYQGKAINYDSLEDYLPQADIIISSTSAPHYVIHTEHIKNAIKMRRGNPMLLIDIAVPRDINPEIARIDNVYLYNIDDLQTVVNQNIDEREKEFTQCQIIIDKEVEKFMAWFEELKIGPAIAQLRNHFHKIGEDELERLRPKLENIAHEEWEHIVYSVQRTINKILHKPAKVGKEKAKNGGGYKYVETIKNLFGIHHHDENKR